MFGRALFVLFLAIGLHNAASAAITVDTVFDGDDGECIVDCTLREAIAVAPDCEEILLPSGVYSLSLGAIGDLGAVDALSLVASGQFAATTEIVDPVTPAPGTGLFYLVRLDGDCSAGEAGRPLWAQNPIATTPFPDRRPRDV